MNPIDQVGQWWKSLWDLGPIPWWAAIAWIIGLASAALTAFAVWRNRYQVVKVHKLQTECTSRHPDWDYHNYIQLELLCVGADVFDLSVVLECDHSYWRWLRRIPVARNESFKPVGEHPNPFRNGQVARFELGDHAFRNLRERRYADLRTPSQLWPGKVRIAVYHSGKRQLLVISSWSFRSILRLFDSYTRAARE